MATVACSCELADEGIEELPCASWRCPHAPIDEVLITAVPAELDGLVLNVNGEELVPEGGAPVEVHKAQYGYRRSPQLWQKWVATELEAVGLERSQADSTMFFSATTGGMVTFHVAS